MSAFAGVKEAIRRALRADGATQADLARHLGVSQKHVSQVLSGKVPGSPAFIEAMAEACGLALTAEAAGRRDDGCQRCGHSMDAHVMLAFDDPLDGGLMFCPDCGCVMTWSAEGHPLPAMPLPHDVAEFREAVFGKV